jgi:hypothetical protein
MDSSSFDRLTMNLGTRFSRRRALAIGAAGLATAGLARASAGAIAQDATPQAAVSEHPAFLFVQLADSGTWIPKPDEEGVYLLTLSGTGEQTLYFSDRPDRIVGTLPTDEFLNALGFTPVEPPNAAVVVTTPEGERDVLVVELFNPVYTRTFGDNGEEFLTYEALVLNSYRGEALEEWVPQADDDQLPAEFTNVSLFIDDCANITSCYKRSGSELQYVGEIPGGPFPRCFDSDALMCRSCIGSDAHHSNLCYEFYEECDWGTCTINS